jgi:hypothetical protein
MKKVCLFGIAAVLLLSLSMVSRVSADIVTEVISFTASSFSVGPGSVDPPGFAPVSPVTGEFSITFDPTKDYPEDTEDISVLSLNINLGSSIAFTYYVLEGYLRIGGAATGTNGISWGPPDGPSDDFWVILYLAQYPLGVAFDDMVYCEAEDAVWWQAGAIRGSVRPVPIPAASILFGTGLIGLAVARLRKRWEA